MKCLIKSWLRPSNRPASVTFPFGPSNMYSLSILTHGNARFCALSWSRSLVNSFSFVRRAVRALSHSSRDTTRCCVAGVIVFFLSLGLSEKHLQIPEQMIEAGGGNVRTFALHAALTPYSRITSAMSNSIAASDHVDASHHPRSLRQGLQ